jgi:MFS superfamily sulfate permease-like transporter
MATARFRPTDVAPVLAQLHGYSRRALGRDLLAAFSIAAALVPQGLAYGTVAGLPPAAGLYTAVGAALVFSLVTSTRFVVVGPSSTLALMTFEAVHGRGCEVLLARVRTPVLAALRANPYRQGATRELLAFPSVRQAYAHAQEKLELRRDEGGNDPQLPQD